MAYVLGPDRNHPSPVLKRLDHIICHVPDIHRFHDYWTRTLDFPEAWPIGPFWPDCLTCGIVLGGINLELIQHKSGATETPYCDTLVFEPTSVTLAERRFAEMGIAFRATEKWETDPELLHLRGFEGSELENAQLICLNVEPTGGLPIPFFLCEYAPRLHAALSPSPRSAPYGQVIALEVQMEAPGAIWKLSPFGYVGKLELFQTEAQLGPPRVIGIKFEYGAPDSNFDLGFRFI